MRTIKLHIEDSIYQNIMFLLNNLNLKGLKIEKDDTLTFDDLKYNKHSQSEKVSKIGFHSKSFPEDSEDYSKW